MCSTAGPRDVWTAPRLRKHVWPDLQHTQNAHQHASTPGIFANDESLRHWDTQCSMRFRFNIQWYQCHTYCRGISAVTRPNNPLPPSSARMKICLRQIAGRSEAAPGAKK